MENITKNRLIEFKIMIENFIKMNKVHINDNRFDNSIKLNIYLKSLKNQGQEILTMLLFNKSSYIYNYTPEEILEFEKLIEKYIMVLLTNQHYYWSLNINENNCFLHVLKHSLLFLNQGVLNKEHFLTNNNFFCLLKKDINKKFEYEIEILNKLDKK